MRPAGSTMRRTTLFTANVLFSLFEICDCPHRPDALTTASLTPPFSPGTLLEVPERLHRDAAANLLL